MNNNMDVIKKHKYELLGGKRAELIVRSEDNPYLLDVIKQYDMFDESAKHTTTKLVDALHVIKQHLTSLIDKHKDKGDGDDMMAILQHDLQMVENAIMKNELK